MSGGITIPSTNVLAIASHVSYGYVGNTMATFCMQSLGIEVTTINTVYFSNHTAYQHWKGRKVSAQEITELYQGLKENQLNDFDMMLSGYIASKEAVQAVGSIAKDLRSKAGASSGRFFWVLDPVMGDNGKLYVSEEIVPMYKALLPEADLIVPNAFEAELLSGVKIVDKASLAAAMTTLHVEYKIPHIIITSVRFSQRGPNSNTLTVFGSSCRQDSSARIFSIKVPALPIFFSGTGDMFAALMVARLREAVFASADASNPLADPISRSWPSPDTLAAQQLPLAQACAAVLRSMHAVLGATAKARDVMLAEEVVSDGGSLEDQRRMHARRTRASEVRVVQFAGLLRQPDSDSAGSGATFTPMALDVAS